ncbi:MULTISPECIES: FUSC family protein [Prauserella salsuginis group]|uniref:FUSC family protein n=2 Tax=Prauserella salsuginis group TaxID=2893672 RepID=A0ABW6FYZ6_9PSEU|nr:MULTISPECIES: FUSC family protein [Prauserella salsuginis group]MBB3663184.1 putative membrane protein YccC [Prauserella sediminis]
MSPPRADLPAPRWLAHLLRTNPAPVPWSGAARAAVTFAVPIAVGYLLGAPATGALVSAGVLPVVTGDVAGPYRYRAKRLGGTVLAAIAGFGIGLVSGADPWLSHPTVVAVAAVSALISAGGNNASFAALQLFVFVTLGTGQAEAGADVGVALLCIVTGGVWGLLVALSGWPVRGTSPERTAVAQVYIELAAMHSAPDDATSLTARAQLTTAMNTAYDRLLTARSWLSGRDATYRRLLNLLSATTPAVEASVAMVNAGQRAPKEIIAHFTDLATAVLADMPLPEPPDPESATGGRGEPADSPAAALYHALTRISTDRDRRRRAPSPWHTKLGEWLDSLTSGPLTWVATARLTLCVALAELARLIVPLDNSYWITLTVGLVLKPDFGSVFGRAVLRGVGTVVGVGIGAAILGLGADSHGVVLVLLVAIMGAGVAIGKVRNYGILSAFVTPLIILQMDLTIGGDWGVVIARLADTVLGCAIVLVFGYLLWPGSLRPRVGGRLAEVADTVARYVAVSLGPSDEDRAEQSRCRRRAYRGLSDLRTAFQQLVVEPSPAGRQAAAWWPAIVALEQVTDAVTAVVVTISHGAERPAEADVRLVTAALGELASAVRESRDPGDVELPASEQLSGVTDQLSAAFAAVRGPDPMRPRFRFRRR